MVALHAKRPRMGVAAPFRGLSKLNPSEGKCSMKRTVNRLRRARKYNPLPLFEWAESQRRLHGRPSAAERMLRHRGYAPSTAALLASLAGFPVEGD